MSSYDLIHLTDEELSTLATAVQAELADRKTATKVTIIQQIKTAAAAIGLSLTDLVHETIRRPVKRTYVPGQPRYANPLNPQQTWTGRGRKPSWVKTALLAGESLDALKL